MIEDKKDKLLANDYSVETVVSARGLMHPRRHLELGVHFF